MACLLLNDIPGFREALSASRSDEYRTREDAWTDPVGNVCGFKIRPIRVRDYVLLVKLRSPFISRREPTKHDLGLFLWMLSPGYDKWLFGWRRFTGLRGLAARWHGLRVHWRFCRDMPASSEPAVVECFKFVEKMFLDSPPSVASGRESGLHFITGWMDRIRAEYHASEEEVWLMSLPKLFSLLKAINQRTNPEMPNFDQKSDRVKIAILRALRQGLTLDDLKAGKLNLDANN